MSLKSEVTLEWADGEFLFALKGDQIEELQHQCGKVGFGAIYQRVALGVWFFGDLYHTIRLGLIGGGMDPIEARRKCDMYVRSGADRTPLAAGPSNPETVARAILGAVMLGVNEVPPGEQKPGEPPADSSTLQTTEPPSPRQESTPAQSGE